MNRFLSKSQIQKLNQVGIHDLYSFITMLPTTLEEIKPLNNVFDTDSFNEFTL